MIRYYKIIKRYFSLGANNKKCLFHLFLSAFLRSITLLALPFIASKIIDSLTSKNYLLAFYQVLLFLVSSLIYVLCHHYNYVAYNRNSVYTHNKLQQLVMEKVTTYDEDFTKNIKTSFIVNTAFKDIGEVMQIPDQLFDCMSYLANIILSLIILSSINIYMGIFSLILLIFYFFYLNKNLSLRDYYLDEQRKSQDDMAELMGQVIDGAKEVKAFHMEEDLDKYLEKYKKSWKKSYFQKRVYQDRADVFSPIFLGVGKIIIYFIAIKLILEGSYSISMLILVIGYYEDIEDRIESFYGKIEKVCTNSTRVDRVYKLLNYHTKNMLSFGNYKEDNIKGKIAFQKVSFTYQKQEILKNIDFEIKEKSFTAIVGKSGSGKSTIFRLLLRLYKVEKGCILLDDVNINEYSKDIYSSNVSIVTQKPFIFDMSIRENFSLVDKNIENQIKDCKRVGIHDYIMSLKDGYHTKLEKNAENISSGQKQLLALARVLLSKSEVLLFDEVTSTLDMNTSKKVMKILKDLKKDHTILMITHKPSLMKMADDILVIDKGRLVARGNHKKLIKESEAYQLLQNK